MVRITLSGISLQSGISVVSLQDGKIFEDISLVGLPKNFLASFGNLPQNVILLQNVLTILSCFCSLY